MWFVSFQKMFKKNIELNTTSFSYKIINTKITEK